MKCELCKSTFKVCVEIDWEWATKQEVLQNFKYMFFYAAMAIIVFAFSVSILVLGAKRMHRDLGRYHYNFFHMPFLNHELTIITGALGVLWSLYFIVRHYFTIPKVRIVIDDEVEPPHTHSIQLAFPPAEGELAKS